MPGEFPQPAPETVAGKRVVSAKEVLPRSFDPKVCVGPTYVCIIKLTTSQVHFDARALDARLHPTVASFMDLTSDQILDRYTSKYPNTDRMSFKKAMAYRPQHFLWGGAILCFNDFPILWLIHVQVVTTSM